ncbi:MAG TPA: hypothetical protein VLL08_29505 [Kineosporiaceae bacterium]|nr:hypothetical protein [Kineosporiaceae bacterium]
MLAIAAAVIFGIQLLLDFADVNPSDPFNWETLVVAGLFCLALHMAGVGTGVSYRRGRR